jgi:hypothetical protein
MLDRLPVSQDKNSPRSLLGYGYIDESLNDQWTQWLTAKEDSYSDEPLSFEEMTSYASWFAMHPEKQSGKLEVTTSFHFPLKVSATKEDVIKMLDESINNKKPSKSTLKMKLKAKAIRTRLALQKQSSMNGTKGSSVSFSSSLKKYLNENKGAISALIANSQETMNGLGNIILKANDTPTLSFEQVQERYNKGITEGELRAWVWYKRSLGVPMRGWEMYFIDKGSGIKEDLVQAKGLAQIYDNHFRPLVKVADGQIVGKKLKKSHKYNGDTYQFFRDQEGIKMIKDGDYTIAKSEIAVDEKQLIKMVKEGDLFYHNGELLPYPAYAYANMYDREVQLNIDRDEIIKLYGEKAMKKHEKVVSDAKPKVISFQNPDPTERPKLLAIGNKSADDSWFSVTSLKEEYAIEFKYDSDGDPVSLQRAFQYYLNYLSENEKSVFQNVSAQEIWSYYVKSQNLPRYMNDSQKEIINKYAPVEGEILFSRFLYDGLTIEDQQKLDILWNRTYNGWSNIPFNRIPIGFESSAKFKQYDFAFTPIQREGIAFMELAGSGCIAYDVGVGKTVTAIIALANAIQSGKCSRPMIVVPNATYVKWIREIVGYEDDKTGEYVPGVLTNTGVTINDWFNLGTAVLPKVSLDKKVPANSITMLTYEGFIKLGYSEETMEKLFDELKVIMSQENTGKASSQRDIEKQYQKYRELLGVGNKGSVADIESLGLDYLVIDEAHNFKNIFSYVPTDDNGNKRFNIEATGSDRGIKCFFLANYIQRTYGSNVMLLTATPFTNNPIEIYSMTSLIGYSDFVNMGILNLYDFMETFIMQSLEYVNTHDGKIKQKQVVKSFNNRLILQKLIYNNYHYKTGEEAGVKRPCKVNLPRVIVQDSTTGGMKKLPKEEQLVTFLEMTEDQKINQTNIIALAQSGGTRTEKAANTMKALGRSLNNALSPYIYDGTTPESYRHFVDESPKIKYAVECIRSVKKYHEDVLKTPVSGQVIYMNRGKEYFTMIKEYLEAQVGYKESVKFNGKKIGEVEILTSQVTKAKKEFIKDAFLAGVCKVIIGTATIREGIDLQTYGTVVYNLYPDWNPTDVKQLEGRIHRQGNTFGYVRSVMPLVQDSMDVFVFQKLEEKTSRVNDLWYRADRGNVLDVEALDPEEVKFALYTNIDELAKIVVDKEINAINRRIQASEEDINVMQEVKSSIMYVDESRNNVIDKFKLAKLVLQDFRKEVEKAALGSYNQWEGVTEAQLDELEERSIELVKEIQRTLEQAPYDDKDIIRIYNRLKNSQYVTRMLFRLDNYEFEKYKTYFSKVAKAQSTVLQAKGYSLNSNFDEVIEDLTKAHAKIQLEKDQTASPEYKNQIIESIIKKKSENKVDGRPPTTATEDFQQLNYLLGYAFNDTDIASCEIPKKPASAPKVEPVREVDGETGMNLLTLADIPASVKRVMPKFQQQAIVGSSEHWDVIERLDRVVKGIPTNDEKGMEAWMKNNAGANYNDFKKVHLHYFYGGSDWWITDMDKDGYGHGYVVLNGDTQMSEYGGIYIPEILDIGKVELDFYWDENRSLAESLYRHDSTYFPKPYEKQQDRPAKSGAALMKKRLALKAKAIRIRLKLQQNQ